VWPTLTLRNKNAHTAVQYEAMNNTMESSKKVIHDYDEMRKLVQILKHNIGRVRPQTTFDSDMIFNTFYEVETIAEELRILKLA
jgi:hypothetical protein